MHFREILLYGSALTVPFVSGRSIFDWGQETIVESEGAIKIPNIIGLETQTTLTREPEIATLEVWVKASAPTKVEALEEAAAAADRVAKYLNDMSMECGSPIESWKMYDARVQRGYYDDDDFYFEDIDFDGIEVSHAEDSLDRSDTRGKSRAKARFTIKMSQIDAIEQFKHNITTSFPVWIKKETGQVTAFDIRVVSIKWDLSEASTKDFKKELRAKALSQAIVEGQDYAEIFGMSSIHPVECEETWTYVGEKYDWRYDDLDGNTEPREIEGNTGMKCKFSLA